MIPLTRLERGILLVGLIVGALASHWVFCDWSFGSTGRRTVLVGWSTESTQPATQRIMDATGQIRTVPMTRDPDWHAWGVVIDRSMGSDKGAAMGWGVTIPGILMVLSAVLLAGWRRSSRMERGLCLPCGYDLKFKYESGCPECGWRRSA